MSRIALPKIDLKTPAPALNLVAPPPLPTGEALWKLYSEGRHGEIVHAADQRLATAPDDLHISGLALIAVGRLDEGVRRLRAATTLYPDTLHGYTNAAVALLDHNQPVLAEEFMRAALPRFPDVANTQFMLGNALLHQDRPAEAVPCFREALRLNAKHHDARMNLANSLRRVGEEEEAIRLYEEIISDTPRQDAIHNLMVAINDRGEKDEAKRLAERVLAMGRYPQTEFTLATILLAEGDYARGWDLYRARWECEMAKPEIVLMTKPIPATLAELKGRFVLVMHEQGLGDTLQFCRYVPLLQPHAGRLVLLVPPALRRLMEATMPPSIQVITDRSEIGNTHDVEVPLLNAPYLLGTTMDTIPATLPYLKVPATVANANRLPARDPSTRLRVGLVWAGQSRPHYALRETDRRRSMRLSMLEPLRSVDGVEWQCLQLGEPLDQLSETDWPIRQPLVGTRDYLDTAAVIQQLDLVLTVDTSVAHCAAGLGVPTWIMSRWDGCWRWFERGRGDSPWYPNTARVFWQRTSGDWSPVVDEVREALAARAAQPPKA